MIVGKTKVGVKRLLGKVRGGRKKCPNGGQKKWFSNKNDDRMS